MGFLFEHHDNLGHDAYRLADVGAPGSLHPYRGLGDVVQEAAHLALLVTVHSCEVSFRAFWGCRRKYLLIGFFKARRQSTIVNWLVHLLVGLCSQGEQSWGAAGQRAKVSVFYILYFDVFIYVMEIERDQKGTPNVSITRYVLSTVTKAAVTRQI